MALAALCLVPSLALANERVSFVGAALDLETREADRRLRDYLERTAEMRFAPEELEYGQVIERLAGWDPAAGVVIARTTPYLQVVAEMLGAKLEILATYVSEATGETTYHAYYAARKTDLPANPTPADVISFIAGAPRLARFTYHNVFPTSSFFLPSLHFRANGVFQMAEPTESLAPIQVTRSDVSSSSHLVREVARGTADLAAVRDGTRAKFVDGSRTAEDADVGRAVAFVRLPSAIPNDLLACSRSTPPELKERIRTAIRAMPADEIAVGDFARWVDIGDASEARAALARLRWLAREQIAPVTVGLRQGSGSRTGTAIMADAARHAVRLSGTEFVLLDEDFHEHIDTVWRLEEIHDGAARLTNSIPGPGIGDQVFPISFRDSQDLTPCQRFMHSSRCQAALCLGDSGSEGSEREIYPSLLPLCWGSRVPFEQEGRQKVRDIWVNAYDEQLGGERLGTRRLHGGTGSCFWACPLTPRRARSPGS